MSRFQHPFQAYAKLRSHGMEFLSIRRLQRLFSFIAALFIAPVQASQCSLLSMIRGWQAARREAVHPSDAQIRRGRMS